MEKSLVHIGARKETVSDELVRADLEATLPTAEELGYHNVWRDRIIQAWAVIKTEKGELVAGEIVEMKSSQTFGGKDLIKN